MEENLAKVKENIKAACERAGRDAGEVTLVAVSKMKPLEDIETLLKVGQLEYGGELRAGTLRERGACEPAGSLAYDRASSDQ